MASTPMALPDAGLSALTDHGPNRRLRAPLILDGTDARLIDYLHDLYDLPTGTALLWPWPGSYRTDVFSTTVGAVLTALATRGRL